MFIIWDPFMGGWLAVFILFDFPIMLIHRLYTRAKARKEQERIALQEKRIAQNIELEHKRDDYIRKYIIERNIYTSAHTDDELKSCVDEMLLQMPSDLVFFPHSDPYHIFELWLSYVKQSSRYYETIRDEYIHKYILDHDLYFDDCGEILKNHAKDMQLHHPDNIMPFSYDVWYTALLVELCRMHRIFRKT